jgi:DNA polymerase III subunit epsilon
MCRSVGGSITPITEWLQCADHALAPLCRSSTGSYVPVGDRWACSQKEAPWQEMMTGSVKLEWLAYQLGEVFYGAHRALVDAEVLLFILTKTGPNARTILSHVLESSARRTFCVWAENAPFDKKDVLKKEKGYRWSDGSSAEKPIKAWYKAGVIDLAAELAMLGAEVYGRPAQVTVDTISGRERYTERYLTRDKMPVAVP